MTSLPWAGVHITPSLTYMWVTLVGDGQNSSLDLFLFSKVQRSEKESSGSQFLSDILVALFYSAKSKIDHYRIQKTAERVNLW